jgi:hypothetical protein
VSAGAILRSDTNGAKSHLPGKVLNIRVIRRVVGSSSYVQRSNCVELFYMLSAKHIAYFLYQLLNT